MLCWICFFLILIASGAMILASYFLNRQEKFTVSNSPNLNLEKSERVTFEPNNKLTFSLSFKSFDGLGRILLMNKDGSIPLLLSFSMSDNNVTLELSHFYKDQWFDESKIPNLSLFSTVTLVNNDNRIISVYLDDKKIIDYLASIPLNVIKVKVFNSLGYFFSNDSKLMIK